MEDILIGFDALGDRLGDLDWLGVVVATVVAMAFGFLWYGPLLGKAWSAAVGVPMQTRPASGKIVATLVYVFLFNLGIGIWGADTFEHAVVAGLVIGVLFVGPALVSALIWARRPQTAVTIDGLHWIGAGFVSALVQGMFT